LGLNVSAASIAIFFISSDTNIGVFGLFIIKS
jgi:hypothetical protein